MGNDAPPQYFAPAGAAKPGPTAEGYSMPQYGAPPPPPAGAPQGAQQSGVVGSSTHSTADVEQGQSQALPPRPPQAAKTKILGVLERFRK